MKSLYGRYINAYLPSQSTIKQLIDVRNSDIFGEVTNYPIILILEKPAKKDNKINVCEHIKDKGEPESLERTLDHIRAHIGQRYKDQYIHCFKFNQTDLLKMVEKKGKREIIRKWILAPEERMQVLGKIRKRARISLEDIFNPHEGLHTGLHQRSEGELYDPFIVNEKTIKKNSLEEELLVPVLEASGLVKRYRIDWNRRFLLYIDDDVEINNYPHTKNYLAQFKDDLEERRLVKRGTRKWYALKSSKRSSWFSSPKLITPDISQRNNFAYDEHGFYTLNTCYVLPLNDKYQKWEEGQQHKFLKYLLGVINSKPIEFYIKHISPHVRNRYYRYKNRYMEPLPLRIKEFEDHLRKEGGM